MLLFAPSACSLCFDEYTAHTTHYVNSLTTTPRRAKALGQKEEQEEPAPPNNQADETTRVNEQGPLSAIGR